MKVFQWHRSEPVQPTKELTFLEETYRRKEKQPEYLSEKKLPGMAETSGKTQRLQETMAAPSRQLRAAEGSGWDQVVQSRAANLSFVMVQEETGEETQKVKMTGLSNRAGSDGSCCVLARLEGKKLAGWDARINKAQISWSEKPIN